MKFIQTLLLAAVAATISIGGTPDIALQPDLKTIFDKHGVEGSILIYDAQKETYTGYNLEMIETEYSPASTFKIFNALVSLETGAVKTESDTMRWDGKDKGRPQWNKDHNLRSGMKFSVVWFYRELARRVGEKKMKHHIDLVGYGNKDMSGGIDLFWLTGGLRISSLQQIDFLRRLRSNNLPFSQRSIDIVKNIIIMDSTDTYVMRAKTGWSSHIEPEIGWLVGYIETKGNVYFFSTNIIMTKPEDAAAREAITREVFKKMGILQ